MSTPETEVLDEAQIEAAWNEEAALLEAGDTSSADATAEPAEPQQTDVDSLPTDEVDQKAPDSPESAAEPEDPYEGLPPAAAERLRALERDNQAFREANQQLLQRVSSSEGRFAAIQREFQQARQAAASVPAQDAPTQTEMAAAAKNPEKWEALKKDFPEWADAMEEFVSVKLSSVAPQTPGIDPRVVAKFVHDQVAQSESRFDRRLKEARIEGKYPDWIDLVNSPEFSEWAISQPPEIAQLAHSDKADDAIRMLDMYHEAKQKSAASIKQNRAGRLAAAATVRPGQTPPPRSLEDMSPDELWNYEAQQREKKRKQQGL